jgi:fumarylacetoacetase
MLAHHTITGCNMNTGDLLGSGTISGKGETEKGSLLEQTNGGNVPVKLSGGQERKFIQDGDTLVIKGACRYAKGSIVGFGECVGLIAPAIEQK